MNSTPCSVSRDELAHDLAQGPEMTRDEREAAERDAIAHMMRIVAPRSTSLIAAHHDGRTLIEEAFSEGLDGFAAKDMAGLIHYGSATGDKDYTEFGRLAWEVVEKYVRNQRDFEDVVQEQHNTRLAAQAEQAQLDREDEGV